MDEKYQPVRLNLNGTLPDRPPTFVVCDSCGTVSKLFLSDECLFNACKTNRPSKEKK